MNTDNTQDGAEPSPASAGSHEPVAWWFKCAEYESVTLLKEHADEMAENYETTPIPLYREQVLTELECEALEMVIEWFERPDPENETMIYGYKSVLATLRGLMERLQCN